MNREEFFLQEVCGKVLDVGCVQGRLHSILKNKKDINLWGVDVVNANIPKFRQGNIEALPFGDGDSFDCIVLGEVLEHSKNQKLALEECHRILQPKGHLLVSTPNKAGWANLLFGAYEGKAKKTGHGHEHLFTPKELNQLLERTGFAVESTTLFPYNKVSISATRFPWFHYIRMVVSTFVPKRFREQIVTKAVKK